MPIRLWGRCPSRSCICAEAGFQRNRRYPLYRLCQRELLFQGTIEVTVEEQEDVSYSVAGQQPLSLNADDFNRICRSHTGRGN